MIMQKSLRALLIFILCAVGLLPVAHGGGFIQSTVWDSRQASLSQSELTLNLQLVSGPGYYNFNVFYSNCSTVVPWVANYSIVPRTVNVGGVSVPLKWGSAVLEELNDDWLIIGGISNVPGNSCFSQGSSGHYGPGPGFSSNATGGLEFVPPGTYSVSISYYSGAAAAQSREELLGLIKSQGLSGAITPIPPTPFNGVAACAQDSSTPGTSIDFGTVTSNGTVQPGPLTTLGLICNYDVALNDVTYSLTSNNPVTGEPSTGQNVAVALTNGATVKLDGGNVTQPDPKKVSVNISPSIDTRGAIAGEGTGSATLTFTYE